MVQACITMRASTRHPAGVRRGAVMHILMLLRPVTDLLAWAIDHGPIAVEVP